MKHHSLLLAAVFALQVAAADLPTGDGLVLRFDASAQAAGRRSNSFPSLPSRQPVDFLLDTSGRGNRAEQPVADRRPVFVSDGAVAYLQFDGKDDFLAGAGLPHSVSNLTVFVLAAPRTNAGNFSGLFSAARLGQNDYTSGFNLDFGPAATKQLSVVNVESPGAGGFRDLLVPGFLNATERPFGDFHVFTVRSRIGKSGVEFFLDGFKGGERDRLESTIGWEQIVIGGRFYSNDGAQPPNAQGCFDGAIADVLVYDRALSDDERQKVESFLLARTVLLQGLLHGARGHALETVSNPPPVQMLVPGFTVQELPLKIGNLNNVRYRHDGKLVGLGYDGRIYLLTDTDGDGLEDKAEFFWDQRTLRGPIGMALTGAGDPRGDGVFVGSKGKVSLILDSDRDGRADEEKVIATGWKEGFQNVDTVGLAIDPKDGAIYFGMGCANFANGYLIDAATGRAGYDIHDIHGTIQRLSADFSKRETVCTGVRFTCALAFNRAGDLFATDQEGATWMPNGNPLDELLHIEPGRHYGFPPRHPKHLPDVRDEPAVIEFAPQHQSTVGLVFNEGVNGGPQFGPSPWQGDAIVSGESRGKLWRTRLAKTPLGYVAQNHLIACLGMLTIDSCVSPQGDLVVACHSGPPDWGTGPAGEGRLFKIRYTGRAVPQPVLAWAAAPDEFRVAFDRPLDPRDWADARSAVRIEAGHAVSAGDRFEVMRPGYQVVRDQLAEPRRWVDVLGLSLAEDYRTLVLRVPRQSEAVNYAITLPLPKSWAQSGGITQFPQIDVLATLNGLLATVADGSARTQSCVLPHPSLAASETITAGSAEHERFLKAARVKNATLSLRGFIDTSNPFVPAVQPGAKLDWDPSADAFASKPFLVRSDFADGSEGPVETVPSGRWLAFASFPVQNPSAAASGLYLGRDDLRHPLSPVRLYTPWASGDTANSDATTLAKSRTDVKGNWLHGRLIFFSEAGCSTCHAIRGEGMAFGPDLSNLIFRDRDSVLLDILKPSSTINPDQTGTLVTLTDGTSQSGLIRSLDDQRLVLGLPAEATIEISRTKIRSMEPLKTSLMPEGFGDRLDAAQLEDLLTFLLLNPLEPAPLIRADPPVPAPRRLAEVAAVLDAAGTIPPSKTPPLRILLCAGPKDHGPDEHDYPLWLERWSRLLALADSVTVDPATNFPSASQLESADVAVFYNANAGWSSERAALLDQFHQRGGGAVYLHYAIDGGSDPDGVAERMGLAFTLGSRFRHGEFDLVFGPQLSASSFDHPITRGFPTFHFTDETYWLLRGQASRVNVLASVTEDSEPRPQLWTLERYQGRIVGCIPGHYTWTFDDPLYRILVLRSICWAARQENPDRLADLAGIGSRVIK